MSNGAPAIAPDPTLDSLRARLEARRRARTTGADTVDLGQGDQLIIGAPEAPPTLAQRLQRLRDLQQARLGQLEREAAHPFGIPVPTVQPDVTAAAVAPPLPVAAPRAIGPAPSPEYVAAGAARERGGVVRALVPGAAPASWAERAAAAARDPAPGGLRGS